ncbi:hypothetical protein [Arthrobacter sp.]|uniref:hypothetical protein n=1 Tax=Arthrobacter sp. TaxID=1667 RepID=UPI003A8FCE8F
MGYLFHVIALASIALWVWMFETRPDNPGMGFGQFMLILAVLGTVSAVSSLAGLLRIRAHRAAYWWLTSLVALSGLTLLAGTAMDYSAGSGGADIGGILLMILGAWGLAFMETLALLWTAGVDVTRLVRPRRNLPA